MATITRTVGSGDVYGHLKVLEYAGKNKHGGHLFKCRCDCGNTVIVQKSFLFKHDNIRCIQCSPTAVGLKKRKQFVGKTGNGWEVLREIKYEKNKHYYECRCLGCNEISVRSAGQIALSRSARCVKCRPNYHFVINGASAIGTLPSGETFTIASEDAEKVLTRYWRIDKDGYLRNQQRGVPPLLLHRWLLGVTDSSTIVDHINRDRLDCRRANLRIVTATQNSINHGLFATNKTGYTGVYYSKWSRRYEVKVGYKHRRIRLGSSKDDLVRLAQMYNIAAQYLYGEYVGELNDVPPPDDLLITTITKKCEQYKKMLDLSAPRSAKSAVAV